MEEVAARDWGERRVIVELPSGRVGGRFFADVKCLAKMLLPGQWPAEMQQYFQECVNDLVRKGVPFGSAVCQARREFGIGATKLHFEPLHRPVVRHFRRFPR